MLVKPTNQPICKRNEWVQKYKIQKNQYKKANTNKYNKWMENHALPQPTFCTENDLDETDYDAADVSLCWLCIIKTPFPCYLPW